MKKTPLKKKTKSKKDHKKMSIEEFLMDETNTITIKQARKEIKKRWGKN